MDASRIAVAGQSCGGTQAYAIVNKDPRITAIGIFNSGMINATDTTPDLVKVPIFFFLGGPTDIAYANVSFYPLVVADGQVLTDDRASGITRASPRRRPSGRPTWLLGTWGRTSR